ncbi:MAG: AsmA family protein [Pseudomonadota bacterium]
MSLLKRPLVLIGALLLILVAALAIVPFLIPTDVYRTQIEKTASAALDRDVTLDEDVSLSLLPRVAARVGGVSIANPEGFSRPDMLTAGELRAVVKWGPLLSGRVEIAEFVFDGADLKLERLENGEANWEFASTDPSTEEVPDPTPEPAGEPGAPSAPQASIGAARLSNANVQLIDAAAGLDYAVTNLNILARMDSFDAPLTVDASGEYQANPFSLDLELGSLNALLEGAQTTLDLDAGLASADIGFDGTVTNSETPSVSGTFNAEIAALTPLLNLAAIDLGLNLDPVGRIEANGTISGATGDLTVSDLVLTTDGDDLESRFEGGANITDIITTDGRLTLSSGNLGAVLTAIGIALPVEASLLEAVDIALGLSGPVDALSFTDVSVTHRGSLLNAGFQGDASLAGDGQLDGTVTASSEDLRGLTDALGSPLPEGDTLNTFDVSTSLSGSFTKLSARDLSATLDDTAANGSAEIDLTGDKPSIRADLTIPTLKLDAFLVESEEPEPQGPGWSDAAVDLAGLDAVNVDIDLKSDSISLGDIVLSNADLVAQIDDGKLVAAIEDAGLFGGQWSGRVALDGSGNVPGATIALDGTAVAVDSALATLAGLDSIGGLGRISLDLNTSGGTIADMVGGLTGTMGANLADGQIKGFNLGQLVRSKDNIVQALADGSLAVALSDEAETDFTAFDTVIAFDNGIGNISNLAFNNPLVLFDGSGSIDLPNQSLDLSIIPKLDQNAAGQGTSTLAVDGIPIPIRLSGSWFSPSIAPDTRLLQQQLQATALDEVRNRAADALGDSLGGNAGSILDGVLGNSSSREIEETEQENAGDAPQETEAAEEETVEDAVEGLVRNQLGGLFGRESTNEPEERAETGE